MKRCEASFICKCITSCSMFIYECPGGGMVDTMVLEAIVERRGSSSLPRGTKNPVTIFVKIAFD